MPPSIGNFMIRVRGRIMENRPGFFHVNFPVWMHLPKLDAFNFIVLHYAYLIIMTLVGSILLYPAGVLKYVDALFFAAGSATQSGLNTIDINTMKLYQQIVLIIIASLCNPIFINTIVVFVRLYWFEKRFQHIIREARLLKRERTRSRTKSELKNDPDLDRVERGVGGREIKILHEMGGHTQLTENDDIKTGEPDKDTTSSNGQATTSGHDDVIVPDKKQEDQPRSPSFHREIVFEDELPPEGLRNQDQLPARLPTEQHIAFVENQRNPKDKAALRIPGPRDAERGDLPQRVESDKVGTNARRPSSAGQSDVVNSDSPEHANRNINVVANESPQENRSRLGKLHIPYLQSARNSSPISLRARAQSFSSIVGKSLSRNPGDSDPLPYLSYTTAIGRNSTFVDLTEEQREELGGVEYRSLKTLAWVLIVYNVGFTLLGIVILLPWIIRSAKFRPVVEAVSQSPTWWGFFTPISMFTDLGFTLTPDSMISFQTAAVPLLLGSFLIIIGNTGFPCMLRFVIWICIKAIPQSSGSWEEFRFLLDHPRRCFTLLFPRKATWWLFGILVILNSIDVIFFIVLDLKDPTVTSLPPIFQFIDGLFQAAATRTAGFAVVNLADLHPAIQVSYLVMMYISVFPIAISVRQTNVYEEKSLGIYAPLSEAPDEENSDPRSYLGSHLRRQLSFDLWYVFLGLFLICCVEGARIQNPNDPGFSIFNVLFEIVSAYGTVGLSLGYPGTNASFSAQFKPLSKLIIVAMMLRGRHRGLPYALDRAVLLPGEGLKKDKVRELEARMLDNDRRASEVTGVNVVDRQGVIGANMPDRRATAHQRRDSNVTTDDHGRPRRRSMASRVNLAQLVTGALSAGPVAKEKRG